MTSRGFEPPPIKTTALTLRLRQLGHNVRYDLTGNVDTETFYGVVLVLSILIATRCYCY